MKAKITRTQDLQRTIALLESRLKLANRRSELKPINSAPRDGSMLVLVSVGNSDKIDLATFRVIPDPTLKIKWLSYGKWSKEYNKFWDGCEPSGFYNLTHWMVAPELNKE